MLFPGPMSAYNFTYDNWGANPSQTPGTSVVPGASNAEGSWTQVASSANIAQDCYWVFVVVSGGVTANAAKPHLLDIGVDPAGGTSYTAVISNITCGNSTAFSSGTTSGGLAFMFPLFIKAGSSVAVRVQGANATAGTVRVTVKFWGQPSNPENVPVGMFSETIGTITNSDGVSFTPGNAADGTWVSLGTTAKAMWWWQLGVQINSAGMSAHQTYVDLAVGDSTNKRTILRVMISASTTEQVTANLQGNLMGLSCYCPVPAGAELWVRGRNSAAPVSGYNAVAIGIGG